MIDARDTHARTPLHVAVFLRKKDAARTLMRLGANANALEAQNYDIVTIAAVLDDLPMLKVALAGGCKATNITSPYNGTALIAAAHLGHDEIVRTLIAARAPLDHVNNLGWTAVIELIVLGDGGRRHIATLEALIDCRSRYQSGRPFRRYPARACKTTRLCGYGGDADGRRRALNPTHKTGAIGYCARFAIAGPDSQQANPSCRTALPILLLPLRSGAPPTPRVHPRPY